MSHGFEGTDETVHRAEQADEHGRVAQHGQVAGAGFEARRFAQRSFIERCLNFFLPFGNIHQARLDDVGEGRALLTRHVVDGLVEVARVAQVITSQNRIPLIQNGTIDFECGSTTNNRTRQKDVDFAYTTYVEEVRIAVNKKSGIKSIKDLNGKTVATTTGTTSVQTLRKNERAQGIDFKEVLGKDHADSFLLLESGRADAFVMDGSILAANIARSKNPKDFEIVGEVLSVEPIACMMPKGDEKLKKAIDASIVRQIKDGSLAKLYDKWFMQPIPPNNVTLNMPLSASTKAAWENPNDKPMEDYGNK